MILGFDFLLSLLCGIVFAAAMMFLVFVFTDYQKPKQKPVEPLEPIGKGYRNQSPPKGKRKSSYDTNVNHNNSTTQNLAVYSAITSGSSGCDTSPTSTSCDGGCGGF